MEKGMEGMGREQANFRSTGFTVTLCIHKSHAFYIPPRCFLCHVIDDSQLTLTIDLRVRAL